MKKINLIPSNGMFSLSRLSFMVTLVMMMSAFQASSQSTYYVNDASLAGDVGSWAVGNNANSGTSMLSPKLTIQAAINAASNGDVIVVSAGTYIHNFAVTKSLTIRGAYFNSNAPLRGPSVSDESIITGARAVITIAANNVVIDGFKIVPTSSRMIENPNGTGLTLTNNVVIVNGSRNATYGIFDARTHNISGLTITNNLFQCQTGTGGFIPVYMVRSTGNLVVDNAVITGNTFVNTAHGIYMDRQNVGSMNNVNISNNRFDNIQGVGTGLTGGGRALQLNGLSASSITRNTFNNVYYFGVQVGAANNVAVSENNFTGSSISGVRTITAMNNLTVNQNNFEGSFSQKAIVHGVGSGVLDATCNWFGSNVTTNVTNSVSATGSGTVNTTPFLTSGADDDAGIAGFQPASGTCTGGQSSPLTITSVYAEDIYCSETGSVDIEFTGGTGPFNITWPGGSDNDISSPYTIPNMPAGTNSFVITDANGPVSTNVTLTAKKVLNASSGIGYTSIQSAINDAFAGDVITLCSGLYPEKLNINKSITIFGPNANISPNTDGNPSLSNAMRYEEAIIIPSDTSGALLVASASNLSIVLKGIVFDRDSGRSNTSRFIDQIGRTGNSWTIENNMFINAPYTINGNFYMTGTSTGMSFQFNNNRLTNNNGGNGIALWGTGSTTAISFNNNVWYNNSAWSINANSVVGTITNNYFVEDRAGAALGTWSNYQNGFIIANENNNVTIYGNTFSNLHHGINIYRGDASANNQFRGTMLVSNNFFNNMHAYAIGARKGAYSPNLTNVTVSNNSFVNAPLRADTNEFTLTATCNWFNALNAQTIASGISGNVNYSPWLINGTDDQPSTMGFQPVTGTCTGTAPTISNVTTVPAVCFNNIGTLTSTFSNGTAPYSITLNAETPISDATSPYVFSNLAEGTYTVTITDANGSTVTSTTTVSLLPIVVKKSNNSLTGYSTISDAINNANTTNGDTLYVCPGTYSNAYYNVTKSLTIKGAKNGISGSTSASRGSNEAILSNARFEISANNVTIDGFTFIDGYNRLSETSGIYVHGSKTGLVFTNNIFTRSGAFGIARAIVTAYNQPTELTITNNLFTDSAAGAGKGWSSGMYLNPGTYGTISNNIFEGLNVAMSVETPNNNGLSITNNTFKGSEYEALGLNHVGSLVTVTGNSFDADNAIYMSAYNWGTGIGNAVDATNNTFAGTLASNLTKAQAFSVEDKIQHSVDATSANNPLTGLIRVKANQVYVTTTSGSINRGITAASVGDTVNVSPETYSQNVLVDKSVYLHGANAGLAGNNVSRSTETKILDAQLQVSGTASIVVDGFDFYQTTATYAGTISLTTGNTPVTIQNSIIERWATTTGNTVRGIETSVTTAAISITNNLFRGDSSGGLFGEHKTWNSAIYSNGGNISITNNEFVHTRTAINCDDMSNSVVMNNNIFGNNGTAISFGGTTPTTGSYTISGNSFNTSRTMINLSNVNANFRLDATSSIFNGDTAANLTLAQAFAVENLMYHKGRSSKNGMVRIQAGNVFNTTNTTVANNILYADANDILFIDNGTYDGAITINKKLDIRGQGTGTIIKSSGNTAITYTADASGNSSNDMAHLRNLRITGSTKGILASQVVNNLSLTGLLIDSNSSYGIHLNNTSGIMKNWVLSNCVFNANSSGYYGATASNIDTISFTGCTFSNHVNTGLYVGQSSSTPGNMSNVTINGNTFTNNGADANNQAAMYIEKMTNAVISNNTITNNGKLTTNPRGIIMNLTYANYSNILITGNNITDNRSTPTGGYGILVAARNDASSYNTLPASLTGLVISGNVLNNHFRGIAVSNAVNWDSTSVMNNALSNCHYGIFTSVYGAGNTVNGSGVTMQVENNSFTGSDSAILNYNPNGGVVSATCNWFGSNVQQNISNSIAGDVNYSPWLLDGVDSDTLSIGFQTTSSCSGSILELSVLALDTAIFCKDQSLGYLEFTIVGGIPPYTITLNGVSVVYPNATLNYINDTLPKGVYTVSLTDSIGSADTLSFTVTEPDSILYLTATPNHPQCFGETGSITFVATGGTTPISVDIDGAVYGSSGTESFASSAYTVLAIDANGCELSTEVTINDAPDQLLFDEQATSSVDAECSGLNGQLNFAAQGGNGTIEYSISQDVNLPFTSVVSPLDTVKGTYYIKAVDANNCSVITTLTIEAPLPISLVISNLQHANCYGEDGAFDFKGVGGNAIDSTGFTYKINDVSYNYDEPFNGPTGNYTVVASDVTNTCTASTVVVVNEPLELVLTVSATDAPCFGTDGTISFSATGGTGLLSFDANGDVFSTNMVDLSRPAGSYNIIVTDENSCFAEATVEIQEPSSAITFVDESYITPECFGGLGEISFSAEGGTGAITYTVDNVAAESPLAKPTGTYTVVATDVNGCTEFTTIFVNTPAAISFDFVLVTNLSCNDNASGALDFSALGGTGGIYYSVNGNINFPPTENLVAGTYTISAIDENSCSVDSIVVITEPDSITITHNVTNALCNGDNGEVTFSAVGGTGVIEFNFNNTVASSPVSIGAGNYTLTATDSNSCVYSVDVEVTEPATLVSFVSASATNALCNAGSGSLDFEANGGTGLISYTVNGTIDNSPSSQLVGTYTIVATDANGCNVSTNLTITEPSPLTFSTATPTNALCNSIEGSLTFVASGGTGAITYEVDGVSVTSPSSQLAGTYTVTATDANGCSLTTTMVITEPTPVVLTASKLDASCNSANGQLTFSATGGAGSINITVNGTVESSPYSAIAGTYTLIATDANGCSATEVLTVAEPSAIVFTTSVSNAACNDANGELTFSATGGSGSLTYTVDGTTTSSPFNAIAGIYTIEATDASNCTASTVLTITEPTALQFTNASATNALCNGVEGSLSFEANGGTGSISYLVDGTGATSPSSQLAGTYTVTATDANACSLTTTMVITEPTPVVLTASKLDASCNSANGELTFSATGGTGAISITVNGTVESSPYSAIAGTYTLVATDANGCSKTDVLIIDEPSAIVFSSSVTNALCNGLDGQLTFEATGGTGSMTYTIDATTVSSPSLQAAGNYTVIATDVNSCTSSTVLEITEPALLELTANKSDALCFGSNGSIDFSANGGTVNYTFTVNSSVQGSPFSTIAGTYTVTVSDANACSASTTLVVSEPSAISTSESVTSCHSYTWPVNSTLYNASGVYQEVLSSVNGCDSVVTLNLTIVPYTLINDTVVAFQSYTWRGNTYTVSNTYYDTTGVPECNAYSLVLTITTCANPVISVETTTELTATLAWTGATAPNYRVEYSVMGENNWSQLTTSNTSITITGLNQNTAYDYRVRALCGINSISEWTTDSFMTKTIVCTSPTFNPVTSITFQSATISWSNTGAAAYLLRWRVQGSATWLDSATITNTQTRNFTGLLSSTTYEVSVRSRCLNVVNSDESITTFTTTSRCGMVTITGRTVTSTSIGLSWAAVTTPLAATSYQMNYRGPGMNAPASVSSNITTLTRSKTGLTPNTTYTFQVRSNCGSNNLSLWRDTVITTASAKTAEEFLTANIVNFEGQTTPEGNLLSWSTFNENNCREMILQHSLNGTDYTDLARIASLADAGNSDDQLDYSYTHTNTSFGTHYYRLKSMSYEGDKFYHNEIVTLTKEMPTTKVQVYPNPTKDMINLDFFAHQDNQMHVKVIDMTGRVVKTVHVQISLGQNVVGLGIGEFPQGIYTIQLYQDHQLIHVSKIYKQD